MSVRADLFVDEWTFLVGVRFFLLLAHDHKGPSG